MQHAVHTNKAPACSEGQYKLLSVCRVTSNAGQGCGAHRAPGDDRQQAVPYLLRWWVLGAGSDVHSHIVSQHGFVRRPLGPNGPHLGGRLIRPASRRRLYDWHVIS